MSDKSFDIKVNRRFQVCEYMSLKKGWLNNLDDFRQYVKDLPKLEKNIPWILFLEDSFCVEEIREKNTGQYIPHGRVLVGSGYGDATNIVAERVTFLSSKAPEKSDDDLDM